MPTPVRINVYRSFRNPSKLTPAEERTYELMKEGLSADEIAGLLNVKSKESVKIRMQTIKEKIEASQ